MDLMIPLMYVVLILSIVIGVWFAHRCDGLISKLAGFFCVSVISFGVLMWVSIVSVAVLTPRVEICTETTRIIASKDAFASSGHFFLGFGSINGTSYYRFYYQDEIGGIHQAHVPASKTIIFELNELQDTGEVLKYEQKAIKPWDSIALGSPIGTERYEIRVPVNSVTRKFNL
ncbi:hypothetical protein ACFL3E_02305 [Patescibacteria group bacterium]